MFLLVVKVYVVEFLKTSFYQLHNSGYKQEFVPSPTQEVTDVLHQELLSRIVQAVSDLKNNARFFFLC